MKKLVVFIGALGLFIGMTSSDLKYPHYRNGAFQAGEVLKYRVTYGLVDAGEAVIEVKNTDRKGASRPLYHVVGTGRTLGGFNSFYKVHDVYESFIDQKSIMPWYFIRNVNEGGYKINQKYTFNQDKNNVNNGKKSFTTPMEIQDMISSFYKARTIDFTNIKIGQVFSFKCFMDDEIYNLKIKYVGDEVVKVRKGKFKAHKFVPVVQKGRYFKSEDDVQFWITADENKIPLLVKAKIPVGIVKLHLVDWSGLKNELISKVQ
ncbi:MAG: DUF3108 domain-containing protein [Crocinitomicaceae bacterium]|nr:DUF3108 domain-containing protein [Crocinitomicaceae bacterium]